MRAALVSAAGQDPALAETALPTPATGERLIRVGAAAISHLTKARALGAHYTDSGRFPFGVGIDGVGRLEDGSRVYFALPRRPYGSMADFTVVDARLCVPVPEELDDLTAAAIANPGMSSWAALTDRARIKRGETVLINGATGTSGRLAVQVARLLGAGRIVATGRNAGALEEVRSLGADVTIQIGEDMDNLEQRFAEEFAKGVDIVLDYLWGASAERLLQAAATKGFDAVPMRFVQIGSSSATDIILPAAVLRAKAVELMGSGGGSVSQPRLIAVIEEVLQAAATDGLQIAFKPAAFSDFNRAWPQDNSACRTVFTMDTEGPA